MEVVLSSDTSVKLCQTMRRHPVTASNSRSEDMIMNGKPDLRRAENESIEYEV
jgi:hypothetical protein